VIEVSRATVVENEKNMGGSFPFATFDRDHSFEKEHEFRDNLSNNSSPDRAYHTMIP
jgi:hypothetical protein